MLQDAAWPVRLVAAVFICSDPKSPHIFVRGGCLLHSIREQGVESLSDEELKLIDTVLEAAVVGRPVDERETMKGLQKDLQLAIDTAKTRRDLWQSISETGEVPTPTRDVSAAELLAWDSIPTLPRRGDKIPNIPAYEVAEDGYCAIRDFLITNFPVEEVTDKETPSAIVIRLLGRLLKPEPKVPSLAARSSWSDEHRPNDSYPATGNHCSVCGDVQYQTPGGACCMQGHGGAVSIEELEELNEKK